MKVLDAPRARHGAHAKARQRRIRPPRSLKMKVASSVLGIVLAGGAAFGATNWIVGLGAGSSGEGQSANISNLTISAVASPAPTPTTCSIRGARATWW
jgi:hypothetical protein